MENQKRGSSGLTIDLQNGCLVGSLLERPGTGFAVRLKK
jgi:hypothetical protein